MTSVIHVDRTLADGSSFRLGSAVLGPNGWRFIPNVSGRTISRTPRANWEACLPRWVGYPDRCRTYAGIPGDKW